VDQEPSHQHGHHTGPGKTETGRRIHHGRPAFPPPSLPFEIALGDILAKAIAMSAQALQSLPKDQRLLIIGTTPIHGGLLVFIKHAVSPDIPDDKNDLLQEAPYAQFVPDLNQFSRLYEATFRYDLHNHLASLYLTIPYQT